METTASVELAVQRLKDAEDAADAARADAELEVVAAVREGEPVSEIAAISGISPAEVYRLEKRTGAVPHS